MRSDGIASLQEALAHAGLDTRRGYVAPHVMAARFQHHPKAKVSTNSRRGECEPSGIDSAGLIGTKTWVLLILLLISMLLAGAYILGKKSGTSALAPCYVEARTDLFSL